MHWLLRGMQYLDFREDEDFPNHRVLCGCVCSFLRLSRKDVFTLFLLIVLYWCLSPFQKQASSAYFCTSDKSMYEYYPSECWGRPYAEKSTGFRVLRHMTDLKNFLEISLITFATEVVLLNWHYCFNISLFSAELWATSTILLLLLICFCLLRGITSLWTWYKAFIYRL